MEKMQYEKTPEFLKDLKKLKKRFPSLEDDLETAKRNAIELSHIKKIDNKSVFEIPSFCIDELKICKLKKFACKSLKGRGVMSGIRVTYAFYPEDYRVVFLEMYFKGDKEVEDKKRIHIYLKNV